MAVGRITGPLLSKNLLRDGIDLSFETDLLYLDVTNGRIGIKTANPQYTLDVNGDTNVLALRVATTSTLGNLSIYSTPTTNNIIAKSGDIFISSPTDGKITLNNDTTVKGNLHATGNITAEGSVQIGNITGSDTLSLYADITSNVTPQTPGQYNLGAPGKEWAQGYIDTLVAGALVGKEGGDVNISPAAGGVTNINSNVRIWGNNPLGTAPTVSNTLYVSMDGSDTNDGRAPDASRACRTISGAIRSPFYKEGTSIKVAPGRYFENNPIRMKRLTSIIGSDLRTTFIEPLHKTQDLFWVNSGCYLAQMQFSNGQSGLLPGTGYTAGTNRGAYATAFPPNFGGEKIDLFYSPYIQNCTNQSGPWLYDGTMFIPNQTVQIPSGVGLATWTANTTTMLVTMEEGEVKVGDTINIGPLQSGYVNARTLLLANKPFLQEQVIAYIDQKYQYFGYNQAKCERDTGLIVDSLVQDLVFPDNGYTQSNFAGLQYWNQDGYTGNIAGELTTTTGAINYVSEIAQKIVVNDLTGTRYQNTVTQTTGTAATSVEALAIANDFSIITDVLTNGTAGVTDIIIPNTTNVVSTASQRAVNLLQANKAYLQAEAIAWITANSSGYTYDQAKCSRDTGLIVDALAQDLLFGGTSQITFSGIQYWNQTGYVGAIASELTTTTNAINYVNSLAQKIVVNDTSGTRYSTGTQVTGTAGTAAEASILDTDFIVITDILANGTNGVSDIIIPNSITASTDANVLNAYALLQANKAYLEQEAVAYVEATKSVGYVYNKTTCARDVGYMVDSVSIDLLYGGNRQAVQSGVYYYGYSNTASAIPGEEEYTLRAYNYLKSLIPSIIEGVAIATPFQNSVGQNLSLPAGTSAESAIVQSEVDVATNIITNGPSVVTAKLPLGVIPSTDLDVLHAVAMLDGNRAFLQAEVVAYINAQITFIYDEVKCRRDTGLIVDAIAQDIMFESESQSVFTGVQYWNHGSYVGAIASELSTTTAAINYIKTIAQQIIINDTGTRYQSTLTQNLSLPAATGAEETTIGNSFDLISNILNTGVAGVTDIIVPNSLTPSANSNVINAFNALLANKTYIQAETVAWVDQNRQGGYNKDKCKRDSGVIVDSVISDIVFPSANDSQSTFAGLQYWNQNGYTGLIAGELTTTTNAINYVKTLAQQVIVNNNTATRYQSVLTQATSGLIGSASEQDRIANEFTIITDILTNGTAHVTDRLVANGITASSTATVQYAYDLLIANRDYIAAEAVAYVEATKSVGYTYDPVLCARDVGYMVDSVAFDLLYGGNRQAIQSGVYYYSFNGSSTAIPNEITQTLAAFNHIKTISQQLIQNQTVSAYQTGVKQNASLPVSTAAEAAILGQKFDVITNIISGGPSVVTAKTPISLTKTANDAAIRAGAILKANIAFIQAEVLAFLEATVSFQYDPAKCYRDAGYMVDSVLIDLLYSGNRQAVQAGVYYYSFNANSTALPYEQTQAIAAYDYIKSILPSIATGTAITPYQTSVTQVTSGTPGNALNAKYAQDRIDIITGIIKNGPTNAPAGTPLPTTISTKAGAVNTAKMIEANRAFIVAETIAFLNQTYAVGYQYDREKCRRDVAYMVDSVSYDILYGGNRQAVHSGVYYYGFSNTNSTIPREIPQTTSAYFRLREIVEQLITNQPIIKSPGNDSVQILNLPAATVTEASELRAMVDLVTNIISGGPSAGNTPTSVSLVKSTDANVLQAAEILKANKAFIVNEIIGFVDSTYNNGFAYNQPKCSRDTGLIVDSIAIDLLYNGNTQSAFAGLQYWNQTGYTGLIETEITATTAAINFVSGLAQKIVSNTTATRYQSTVTQVSGVKATDFEVSVIANEFGTISSILNNGTTGVTDIIVPNGMASTTASVYNAYLTLQNNKQFIQAETVAYINSQYKIFDQAKCARDTGLIVDAIAQDLLFTTSSQSTFSGLQYWNQNGYTGLINTEVTTTTNAINWIRDIAKRVVINDTNGARYNPSGLQITDILNPGTVAEQTIIGNDFNVVTNIITNGTANVTDIIVPNGLSISSDVNKQRAYALLQANRQYLQDEAVAFVEATKAPGYVYDQALCARDMGYIVDSVSFDLLYGGNRQAVQSGVYYYGFSNTASAIVGEQANTIAAYNKLRELLSYIIEGVSYPTPLQTTIPQVISSSLGSASDTTAARAKVDLITSIITNGPSVVTAKTPINLTASASPSTINASNLLNSNREFLVAEVLAYISDPTSFSYDQGKCYRDVGYMIDCVSFDLLHGGNRQAVQSGVYYYTFDASSTAIPNEIPQTTAAYNHIRNIVGKIVTNQAVPPTPGNTSTQVIVGTPATAYEVTELYENLDTITTIINNGPTAAPVKEPISLTLTPNPNAITAYNILMANKSFIQAEVIAFVNQFDTGFVYNRAKCARDVGIVVENMAYDIAFGGNEKSRESGLAYWNGVTSYIPNEITETSDAFLYLATLAKDIVANTTTTNLLNTFQSASQVINTVLEGGEVAQPVIDKLVSIINTIITTGPSNAPALQTGDGPDWGSVSAEVLLQANRSFIQNEVLSWINYTYPAFSYREDKCYRDTGLIIDAISQDIITNANAKTIEAAVTYWTGNTNVLENAKFGDKNQVVETVAAINRAKQIALQVINNTTVTTTSFVFNPTKCARDTGLIVDALAQDLLFDGDSQSTFAGIQYWNHGDYTGQIGREITTTTAAINYISSLAQKIVRNDKTGTRYQNIVAQTTGTAATANEVSIIAANFSTVTNILTNGVTGVTDTIVPNNLTASGNSNVRHAYDLLQANLNYLKAEAIAYVDSTKDFKYNPAKCARDSGIIVDTIVMDLLYPTSNFSQATFAGLQYWNQDGYTGEITRERDMTVASINYASDLAQKVILNDQTGQRFQGALSQVLGTGATTVEANLINSDFLLITNIITGGTANVTNIIQTNSATPSTNVNVLNAYELLLANKPYIQAEVVAKVEATKDGAFVYDQALCYRDVGYMIDSIAFDLLHGGNRQAIQSGVYYYNFSNSSSAIPNEQPQTVAAFEYLKTLTEKIALNIPVNPLQTSVTQSTSLPAASGSVVDTVKGPTYRIIDIIQRGPEAVGVKQPISNTRTTSTDIERAAANIAANRAFIVAETIAYVDQYLVFQYNPTTCARDVEYIVNSVSFDLLYGGNRQSVQSGVYYWGYSDSSTSLPKERVASTLAYQFMKGLMADVITATPVANKYQSGIYQVTNLPAATAVEVATIGANIDKITTIINDGPNAAGAKTPIGLDETNNQYVRNAVNLLSANRNFIRAEVIAYVNATQVSNTQVFLPFYDQGANATLPVIRNFDIITNIIENGLGVAPIRSDGNGIFVRAGMSNNDVKIAPVVTAVTTVSSGVYQVDISESTIGYGDAQTLYFGETAVFPKLDDAVPDRWQQRRINPIGSMGGALIDGGVISDRSPINSFVFDAYTQLNQGGNGVFITNNGYAQLVSVFTIFCSNAVTVENGGICSITNSNSNFGDICLTAKGYGKREFSGYVKNAPVLPYYPNGVYPQGGQVNVYIADPDLRPHIALVMEVEPPVGFKNNQGLPGFLSGNTTIATLTTGTIEITGIDNTGMVIGQKFYVIDQFGRQVDSNNQPYVKSGTIVADVGYKSVQLNYPLNSGGGEVGNNNYFNLYTCGNAYYTVLSSELGADPITPGTLLLPNQQNAEESLSLVYLNSLAQKIVNNQPITQQLTTSTQVYDLSLTGGAGANAFIEERLNTIGSILTNGADSSPTVTRTGTLPTGSGSAASLLNKNRTFLQDEIIAYVDQNFFNFNYNEAKCARDTGLIVDALSQDLLFNSNSQSTFSAMQYWNHNGYTGGIVNELSTTTAAINYVKDLAQKVVQGDLSGTRYQNTVAQVANLTLATPAEAAVIAADFNVITNILASGTDGVTDIIQPNSLTSSTNINIVRAYNLLQANKSYIQKEAIAFVETTKPGFKYDQAKCRRDAGLIVEAIALDLAFPTTNKSQASFSGLQYWNQSGYTGAIASELTTTTNAINYVKTLAQQIVQNITTGTRYTGGTQITNLSAPGTASEVAKIASEFTTITTILNTGTAGVTDIIVTGGITASTSTGIVNAYALLQANKLYIENEAIAYVNATKTPGFTFSAVTCARDVGYMIDSVCFDLLYGGNRQAVQSGVYYYNFNGASTAIPNEITTTTNAFNYIKTISQQIVQNIAVTPRQTRVAQVRSASSGTTAQATIIGAEIDLINSIINTGPAVVTTKEPISLTKSADSATLNAASLLLANKDFITAEAISYVNQTYSFDYDQYLCERDVGYMIDSVSIDLLYGGNRQAVQSGVYYYGFNANSTALPNEQTQSVDAYNHINALAQKIILGQTVTPQQSSVLQVTNGLSAGTTAEVSKVENLIANITNIISNGPNATVANVPLPVTPSVDSDAINAAKMVKSNRAFVVAEAVAYVNNNFPGLVYNQTKCARDTGLIVDAIAQDLMFESESQSVFTGVQYWNHGSYVGAISSELTTTTNAINYVKTIAQKVITKDTSGTRYQTAVRQDTSLSAGTTAEQTVVASDFNVILNILSTGTAGVTDIIQPNSITSSTNVNVQHAFAQLQANKAYIQAEAIAYVESTKGTPFIYNEAKCSRDTGLLVDAIVQDLLFNGTSQSTFAGIQYWNHDSYVGAIASELTTTTNAINYVKALAKKVVLNDISGTRYQSAVSQDTGGIPATSSEQATLETEFNLITNILTNGVAHITDAIVPNGITESTNVNVQNAYARLQANKAYLQAEAVAFVETTKAPGFTYNQSKCLRDVGYMVDSVSFDLLYSGNLQAIESGVYYYGYNANSTALPNEQSQAVAAYNYLKAILSNIITGVAVNNPYQTTVAQVINGIYGSGSEVSAAQSKVDNITNIITNGPSVAPTPVPIGLTRSLAPTVINAATILHANREFIRAEIIAFVNSTFGGFKYDQAKCRRDVGYMIDAISIDLLYSGNRQAVQAGTYYFSFNATATALPGEQTQAVATYNYIRSILPNIISGTAISTPVQSSVAQVTSGTTSTAVQASLAQSKVDIINNIITNGPRISKTPLGTARSSDVQVINAAKALEANRAFIVAETIAYINGKYLNYNRSKCRRDVGLIVDALVYDLEKGGNYNAIIAGRSYYAEHGTHHIVQLEENVTDPALFPDGAITTFYQRSYMSASGYLFEYVGAGTNYGSLPQRGKRDPNQSKEVVQLNNGKVFFTSTDQNGDFRIGTGLVISQATGVLSGRTFTKSLFANLTPFILAIEG